MRKLLSFSLKALVFSAVILSGTTFAQNRIDPEHVEKLLAAWRNSYNEVRFKVNADQANFKAFTNFYSYQIDTMEGRFFDKVENQVLTFSNANDYIKAKQVIFIQLYKKFEEIQKNFPSSAAEYSKENPPRVQAVDSPCHNGDFAFGTLDGWNAYYGSNASAPNHYTISGISGGLCALGISKDAHDPVNNTYQVQIIDSRTWAADKVFPALPLLPAGSPSPYCCRVGDSTAVNDRAGILSQTFLVTKNNENFSYSYAMVLQSGGHGLYAQPWFMVVMLDSVGDTIPTCGKYQVVASFNTKQFDSVNYPGGWTYNNKGWSTVFVPLKPYLGHPVTIKFITADCTLGGHFGYAYVSTNCNALSGLITSSPAFCGQKTITLTAPGGGIKYTWTGPPGNPFVGQDTTNVVTIDSAGTYKVVILPVTGALCADTLTITIPKAPGPPPHPSFTADTVCAGSPMQFTNLSNPLGGPGVKFYWDFYNNGNVEDSSTNPKWTYVNSGIYQVKLDEVHNGCGYDTIINVKVNPGPIPKFAASTACAGQVVNFTNQSVGATTYYWNFGDPHSGLQDTSTATNPTHTFDTAGTYTITFVAKGSGCIDTIKQTLTVLTVPKPIITGTDSICPNGTANLNGNAGFSSYSWTGPNLGNPNVQNTTATPTVTSTYTLTVSNGFCSHDTTFTVNVKPIITPTINPKPDSTCAGKKTVLTGGGGGTYKWSTNGTYDTAQVYSGTYTLTVSKNGCTATTSITVVQKNPIAASTNANPNPICTYDSTTLTATGGTSYKWSNGATTSSTKVLPGGNGGTKTYTVYITTPCGVDTLTQPVTVLPLPNVTTSPDTIICNTTSAKLRVSGGSTYSWNPSSTLTCNTCPNPTASPTVTTTYTITVTGANGCFKDTTITVTVKNKIGSVTPNQKICTGSPTALTAGPPGDTYKWSTGATTSTISVSPTVNTCYTVIVSNGCPDTLITCLTVRPLPKDTAYFIPSGFQYDTINRGDTAYMLANSNVNKYVWTPDFNLSCTTCPNPMATPTVTTTYTITSDSGGCITQKTLTVYVEVPCADFKVPNVFTPNNDGRNDDFVVNVLNPTSYSIQIFDRWGKEVYTSTDPTSYWTGHILSTQNMVADGVYFYTIKASCGTGNYVKQGFVQVLTGK